MAFWRCVVPFFSNFLSLVGLRSLISPNVFVADTVLKGWWRVRCGNNIWKKTAGSTLSAYFTILANPDIKAGCPRYSSREEEESVREYIWCCSTVVGCVEGLHVVYVSIGSRPADPLL